MREVSSIEKIPPQNLEAEKSTLGSMMIEPSALDKGMEILKAEDFYRPAHQDIFDALIAVSSRDEECDLITVQEELRKQGKLDDCGGTEYLMALLDAVPTAANIQYYAEIVKRKSKLRKIISVGTKIVSLGYEEADSIEEYFIQCALDISDVKRANVRDTREVVPVVWDRYEKYSNGEPLMGIPFGISRLDQLTNGILPGDFIVIAARPSEGKSALGAQLAVNAALSGYHTLIFSNEMSAESLVDRMIHMKLRLDMRSTHAGIISDEAWGRLAEGASVISNAPITISDESVPLAQIIAISKQSAISSKTKLIIVDYIQIVESETSENRNQEISKITRALQRLARQTNIGVVGLSQLSRASTKRENKRPQLTDLRDSGSIEQEADKVLLIHNPIPAEDPASNGQNTTHPRAATIIVAKHRNGEVGDCPVMFVPTYTGFESMDFNRESES